MSSLTETERELDRIEYERNKYKNELEELRKAINRIRKYHDTLENRTVLEELLNKRL